MEAEKTIIRPRPGGNLPAVDDSRTVIRPRPGGQLQASDATQIKPRTNPNRQPLELRETPCFGRASLSDAAVSLLDLAARVGQLQGKVDVEALHGQACRLVRGYEARAKAANLGPKRIQAGRYMLCSLIDEMVLHTSWGEHSIWSQKSLLRTFHRETYGGERVFGLIEKALGAVRKDDDILELAYHCLSLGFQGKYRLDPRGKVEVEKLRQEIYQVLTRARDRYPEVLSPEAKALNRVRGRLPSFLSLWLTMLVLAVAAAGLYASFLFDLNTRSDGVQHALAGVVPVEQAIPLSFPSVRPEVVRLREILAPEIQRGVVTVEGYPNRVSIVLQAAELFDSGSTALDPSFFPVLDKVAKALEIVPGRVTVAGHTDSQPIRTARFPSNWHLSLARASAVVKHMSDYGHLAGRLLPEGKADTEPVADNASSEGRARNRRVTIDVALLGE